jgi:hypothetical protein
MGITMAIGQRRFDHLPRHSKEIGIHTRKTTKTNAEDNKEIVTLGYRNYSRRRFIIFTFIITRHAQLKWA